MDSLYSTLKSIYPNYEWIPWKFQQTPKNFWSNIENQRKYFHWLSNQLNIKSNEDWYNIKLEQIDSILWITLITKLLRWFIIFSIKINLSKL